MNFVDRMIECRRCKTAFCWTAGEQNFYARQTPPFAQPKMCRACRDARRAFRAAAVATATAAIQVPTYETIAAVKRG